jgi:hypothetical protein
MPLDLSLYPTYPIGTKGFDSSIFRKYAGYVLGYLYLILEQHVVPPIFTPQFVGNQFPTMVQLVFNRERQHVQQSIIALVLNQCTC